MIVNLPAEQTFRKLKCEKDPLYFSRYFFKQRQNINFRVNWHHRLVCDALQKVITGEIKNLIINVPPGSSKTEMAVINFIARGLAINPRARFLHLSYSDDLALLNSQAARDIVVSDEYQKLWPLAIAADAKAKGRWNVLIDGKKAGGVYATSLGGQITGFRAGHMAPGFQGAIIIDDPLKPEDAFSKPRLNAANRKLITTVKSRRANPDTPIILIMQRIADNDPTGFIESGNMPGEWTVLKIPALITEEYVKALAPEYQTLIEDSERDEKSRRSYWPYKERLSELLAMERGEGVDAEGGRLSRHVYAAQYDQNPVALGGNIIKGEKFVRYLVLPKLKYRKIYVDTAQKTKERNDFSVFECWGHGADGKIYLIDLIRGKWEAPELKKRAIAFWQKHKAPEDLSLLGSLRQMYVEDKSSGTGLIQELKLMNQIPIVAVQRNTDKLTRVMDVTPYIDSEMVCVPEHAEFTNDFIAESEAFTADDTHAFDDQVDPMIDAINDMLSNSSKLNVWAKLASKETN